MLYLISPAKALDYETPTPASVQALSTQPQFVPQSEALIEILKAKSALLTCMISEGGKLLCTGFEGALHLWDTKQFDAPSMDAIGHGAEIRNAEFSKYGGYFITASNDGSVRVFDSRSGISLGALPLPLPVYSMASMIDEDRAVCMCGDEQGHVIIVRINGVRDQPLQTTILNENSYHSEPGNASPAPRRAGRQSVIHR